VVSLLIIEHKKFTKALALFAMKDLHGLKKEDAIILWLRHLFAVIIVVGLVTPIIGFRELQV